MNRIWNSGLRTAYVLELGIQNSIFFGPPVDPLPEIQSPNFLEIQNPWIKLLETSDLRFEKPIQVCPGGLVL